MNLNDPVVPFDVRQFVTQHHPCAIVRPLFGIERKQYAGHQNSPRAEEIAGRVLQQSNRPPEPEGLANAFCQIEPRIAPTRFD